MKRIIGIILIICLAFSIVGCDKKKDEDETPAQNADDVVIKVSQTDVLVGGTITFKITLNNVKGVKSLAIRPEMDTESFETVSARPLVRRTISMPLRQSLAITSDIRMAPPRRKIGGNVY